MKILSLLLLILFIIRKEIIISSSINALNLWVNTLFPLLFPTFVLSDLITSSGIVNFISNKFGKFFSKIFNTNSNGLYILLISMLCGSPSNAKNISILYKNNSINRNDITYFLIFSTLFNPFLILSFGGIKCLIIFWISNLINAYIYRPKKNKNSTQFNHTIKKFNLNDSIDININLLLKILGVIVIFSCLINILSYNYKSRLLCSLLFEVTNSLNIIHTFFHNNLNLYLMAYSFAGLSIFIQIKSILKDTFIDFKLLVCSRCSLAFICIIISTITQCIATLTHTL